MLLLLSGGFFVGSDGLSSSLSSAAGTSQPRRARLGLEDWKAMLLLAGCADADEVERALGIQGGR